MWIAFKRLPTTSYVRYMDRSIRLFITCNATFVESVWICLQCLVCCHGSVNSIITMGQSLICHHHQWWPLSRALSLAMTLCQFSPSWACFHAALVAQSWVGEDLTPPSRSICALAWYSFHRIICPHIQNPSFDHLQDCCLTREPETFCICDILSTWKYEDSPLTVAA